MNCESFISWLENRDVHDLSEADRARNHAQSCDKCGKLLEQDEALDRCIRDALTLEPLPKGFQRRIDLSLEKAKSRKSVTGMLASVVALCLVLGFAFIMNQRPDFSTMDQLGISVLGDHRDHVDLDIYEPVTNPAQWLANNLGHPVSPPGRLPEGFRIKGARFCTLNDCRVVHMVYGKDDVLLSVFVVDEKDAGFHMEQGRTYTLGIENGKVVFWKQGKTIYAMVG